MLSIQIKDIKVFMKHLLIQETFDQFLLMQGSVSTYITYDIDGKVNKDFFGDEYESSEVYGYNYTPWAHEKNLIWSLIKGKHTPSSFKFVLHIKDEEMSQILKDISPAITNNINALVITIRYDERGLFITTGLSTKSFLLDKTAEEAWDEWIKQFFTKNDLN